MPDPGTCPLSCSSQVIQRAVERGRSKNKRCVREVRMRSLSRARFLSFSLRPCGCPCPRTPPPRATREASRRRGGGVVQAATRASPVKSEGGALATPIQESIPVPSGPHFRSRRIAAHCEFGAPLIRPLNERGLHFLCVPLLPHFARRAQCFMSRGGGRRRVSDGDQRPTRAPLPLSPLPRPG